MSQISPPVRILLAGAVLFLAAWFTVLHPKADTAAPPVATPVATPTGTPTDGLGRAVQKAKNASAEESAAARRDAGETQTPPQAHAHAKTGSATKTAPAQPAIAIPAKVLATLPHDVSAALQARKTVVLGVIADGATSIRPLADDDRYVRNALRKVNRYDGQVLVQRVPAGRLVRYAPLVGGLHVDQTPSIVVIDGKLHGTVLAGYVDRISINQAIADARRAGIHPSITDPYLRKLNLTCEKYYTRVERWSLPTIPGKAAFNASADRATAMLAQYRHAVARIPAPARWRSLKAQFVGVMAMRDTATRRLATAAKHEDTAAMVATVNGFDFAKVRKLDARFDKAGVTGCVINRRS